VSGTSCRPPLNDVLAGFFILMSAISAAILLERVVAPNPAGTVLDRAHGPRVSCSCSGLALTFFYPIVKAFHALARIQIWLNGMHGAVAIVLGYQPEGLEVASWFGPDVPGQAALWPVSSYGPVLRG